VDFTPGNRGTDIRLETQSSRPSASQRLAARKARRVRPEDELQAALAAAADADSDDAPVTVGGGDSAVD